MADKKVSVDDILQEIALQKAKKANNPPRNDMTNVDKIIVDILIEKKTAQLRKDAIALSHKEKQSLEKEIKAQTKSITRQLKRIQHEEKAVKKEISVTQEDKLAFQASHEAYKQATQFVKLSSIASHQQVKVQTTPLDVSSKEEKSDKLNQLKQSAHSQYIKHELKHITSHFNHVKSDDHVDEDDALAQSYKKIQMTPSSYKEYKKNRNTKIDGFIMSGGNQPLQEQQSTPLIPSIEQEEIELSHDPVIEDDAYFASEKTNSKPFHMVALEDSDDELDGEVFEYTDASQIQFVKDHLAKQKKSILFSLYGLFILSIGAILLTFVRPSLEGLLLFNAIPISTKTYVITNLLLLIIGMALSFGVFPASLSGLINKIPSKDLHYSITFLICSLTSLLYLFNPEQMVLKTIHNYTPIFIISMFFVYLGKLMQYNQTNDNFSFITSEQEHYSIETITNKVAANSMTKGCVEGSPFLVKNVKTDFYQNFLTNASRHDISDVMGLKLVQYILPVALLIGAAVYMFTHNLFEAITMFSGVVILSTTLIGSLVAIFPIADTASVIKHFHAMIPSYEAIDAYRDTNAILLDAYDLFPNETVILHGIKTFSGKRIDDAIIDAASVVCESRSILSSVFLNIIANNKKLLRTIDTIVYEDLMGISAWVDNRRVLIGNRELMINHSIAVPKKSYEDNYTKLGQEVVYLSTGGELSAAFIIQLTANKEIFDVLNLLERNDITAIIKTVDSSLTSQKLAQIFNMPDEMLKILPSRLHASYEKETQPLEKTNALLGTSGDVLGFIISTVATKKLFSCVKFGLALNIVSVIIGVVLLFTLFSMGLLGVVTTLSMLVYMSLFGFIYFVYQKNVHL